MEFNNDIDIENGMDDEWMNFMTSSNSNRNYYNDNNNNNDNQFNSINDNDNDNNILTSKISLFDNIEAPEPSDIYISTKSKIVYLKRPIDLNIFWSIPVIPYGKPVNGIIKKQIKINSKTPEELELIQEKLQNILFYEELVMTHIDNPTGRIKFKDIRKISIGICNKDILSYRIKKKQAFYNCFVTVLRLKINNTFREFHVKVFNTGKLEIPGIQNDEMLNDVFHKMVEILQPYVSGSLIYDELTNEIDVRFDTILINSNFNCRYYINRENMFDILKYKYNIHAIYDPCSYPGIQCKYYYNKLNNIIQRNNIEVNNDTDTNKSENDENIVEVSFMIFRTGSVLIVGMCNEEVLYQIYEFLKNIFKVEFKNICHSLMTNEEINSKNNKKRKIRRKTIYIHKL
jgi:hypothetical protein